MIVRKSVSDTIDDLYINAKKNGKIEFEKSEFIKIYTEFRLLKGKYDIACDKSATSIHRIDSRQEKKEKKQIINEGKKEAKILEKELEELEKKLNPMMLQLVLSEIGGISEIKDMLLDAEQYEKDVEEEKRRNEIKNKISPKATTETKTNIFSHEVIPNIQDSGKDEK